MEVDVIVTRPGGQCLAAEVKLGGEAAIEHGVRSLRRLRDKIGPDRTRPPARLVVLTAGGYGFEHLDGVSVVPVTSLGP